MKRKRDEINAGSLTEVEKTWKDNCLNSKRLDEDDIPETGSSVTDEFINATRSIYKNTYLLSLAIGEDDISQNESSSKTAQAEEENILLVIKNHDNKIKEIYENEKSADTPQVIIKNHDDKTSEIYENKRDADVIREEILSRDPCENKKFIQRDAKYFRSFKFTPQVIHDEKISKISKNEKIADTPKGTMLGLEKIKEKLRIDDLVFQAMTQNWKNAIRNDNQRDHAAEQEKDLIGMRGTLYYRGIEKRLMDLNFVIQYIDHDTSDRKYLISYPEENEFACEWIDLDFELMKYTGDDERGIVKAKFEILAEDDVSELGKQKIKPIKAKVDQESLGIENLGEIENETEDEDEIEDEIIEDKIENNDETEENTDFISNKIYSHNPLSWEVLEKRSFEKNNTNNFAALGLLREAVIAEHFALVKYLCKKGWKHLQHKNEKQQSDLEMLTSSFDSINTFSNNPLNIAIGINKNKDISKFLVYDKYFLNKYYGYEEDLQQLRKELNEYLFELSV